MAVKPIPEGYSGVTPYLIIDGATEAIAFYKKAFGATEVLRMAAPGGKIGHAEIRIAGGIVMMADPYPAMGYDAPSKYGGTPVSLMFYVDDVDAVFARAIDAGAKEMRVLADQFYGDRNGTLVDPFGHVWTIATHKEDPSPEEMDRRHAALMKDVRGSVSGV